MHFETTVQILVAAQALARLAVPGPAWRQSRKSATAADRSKAQTRLVLAERERVKGPSDEDGQARRPRSRRHASRHRR